jgi:hypothetical protein
MGQVLKSDVLGTLAHNAGTLTLTSARLTIGGQQYSVTSVSRLISTDVTVTASTTYFVYAVISAGLVALRISTNVNSMGPSGFSAWKLIGAFLANDTPAFGSFMNIEGTPRTQTNLRWTPSGASGFGTIGSPEMNYTRDGRWLVCDFRFTTGTVAAATAFITLPSGLVWDTAVWQQTTYNLGPMTNNSNVNFVHMFAASSNADRIFFNTSTGALGSAMNGNASPFASGQIESGQFRVPISGWGIIPLKDL